MTTPSNFSAAHAIKIIREHVQYLREEGETDLRNMLYFCDWLYTLAKEGKTLEEISELLRIDDDDV